jgi:hypothetical protein
LISIISKTQQQIYYFQQMIFLVVKMGDSPTHNLKIIIYYNKKETMPIDNTNTHNYASFGNYLASFDANVKIGQVSVSTPSSNPTSQRQIQLCPSLVVSGSAIIDELCSNDNTHINIMTKPKELLTSGLDHINASTFGPSFMGFAGDSLAINIKKKVAWGTIDLRINDNPIVVNDCDISALCQLSTTFEFAGSQNCKVQIAVGEDSPLCSDILSNSWKINAFIGDNFELGLLLLGSDNAHKYDKKLRLVSRTKNCSQEFQGILCFDINDDISTHQKWELFGKCKVDLSNDRYFISNTDFDYTTSTPSIASKCRIEEKANECVTNYVELDFGSKNNTSFDNNSFCQIGSVMKFTV